jgi:hypothetical protein
MISELGTWFGVIRFPVEMVGSCHFEDAMTNQLKFIQEPPHIAITPNRPLYSAGEIGSVRLSIVNGALPRNLKLSVFLRYPDGHIRSLSSSVKMPPNPPCNQWIHMAAIHILSREFRSDWQFGLRLKNMPNGRYILYALMTEPGSVEVVSRSSSIFHLTPMNFEETLDEYGKVAHPPF